MSIVKRPENDYSDGMTKQAFKDSTDINKLMARVAAGQTISHLVKHGAVYGDFSDIDDLMDAHAKLARGQAIFDELPGEVKREFNNSPAEFFKYVNDPANAENVAEALPRLAQPGNQMPTIKRTKENIDNALNRSPAPLEPSPQGAGEPPAGAPAGEPAS